MAIARVQPVGESPSSRRAARATSTGSIAAKCSRRQMYPPCFPKRPPRTLYAPGARLANPFQGLTLAGMRLDKFTVKAQEALQDGQSVARRAGHPAFEPEHLFQALLRQEGGVVEPMLRKGGVDLGLLRGRIEEALGKLPRVEGGQEAHLGQRLVNVLDKAEDEAKSLKDEYTSTEHLLLALTHDRGAVGEILKSSGVARARVLAAIQDLRK